MLKAIKKDIAKILHQRFEALGRVRRCIFNDSTQVYYDEAISGVEISLSCLRDDASDLKTSDEVIFEDKRYKITKILNENRMNARVFLKELR